MDFPVPNYVNPESRAPATLTYNSTVLGITTFVVFLRVYSRIRIVKYFGLDDWVILFAQISLLIQFGLVCLSMSYGGGRHVWDILPSNLSNEFRSAWLISIFYFLTLNLARLSVLTFYLRIFASPQLRLCVWLTIAFTVLQAIVSTACTIFQCIPVTDAWNMSVLLGLKPKKCINRQTYFLAMAILGFVTDLIIAALPMRELWTLHVPIRRKLGLILLLSASALACIVSIIRFTTSWVLFHSRDPFWDSYSKGLWAGIEVAAFMIAASLPATKPILVEYVPKIRRLFGSEPSSAKSGTQSSSSPSKSESNALNNDLQELSREVELEH